MQRILLRRVALSLAVGGLLPCTAAAHDTWILASRPTASPGQVVSFDLTSGMAFPANEVAVGRDRLAAASARLGETIVDLERGTGGKKALQLKISFAKPGIATVWIESKPRSLELKPAQVREYLDEIGAWESVGRKWESEGKGKWRESYTKHSKTYVRVGDVDGDDSWSKAVGMELELVPEIDPTRLVVGDELTLRLLDRGQPISTVGVGLVAAGAKSGSLAKTDSDGRVKLRLDQPGWWLIRATVLEPSSKADLDWETRFTTLTVFVSKK